MTAHLPDELAVEILKRLPVESLVKCRCVCKTWCSLIDDPDFAKLHLNLARVNFRAYAIEGSPEFKCYICDSKFAAKQETNLPLTPPDIRRFYIIDSCDGLLLGTFYTRKNSFALELFLWNPSINKILAINDSKISSQRSCEYQKVVAAFCFNDLKKEHEIMRMYYSNKRLVVELYSLGKQAWRTVPVRGVMPGFTCIYRTNAFVNGCLHWPASRSVYFDGFDFILSFDLHKEVFREISLPKRKMIMKRAYSGSMEGCVGAFRGFLALIETTREIHEFGWSICNIWVMKDSSWAKYFVINRSELGVWSVLAPVTFGWDDQLLIWTCRKTYIAYNLETKKFTCFGKGNFDGMFPYVQSLLLNQQGDNVSQTSTVKRLWYKLLGLQ